MDEEDKLPLFGVQPEDLQNIDTGFGSLSENPQAQNALMGNFTSLPVSQARTPSPNNILMGQAAPAVSTFAEPAATQEEIKVSRPEAPMDSQQLPLDKPSILQEILRSPITLGENIGKFIGEQKYGTGISAEGEVTGRPLPEGTLPAQTATLLAGGAELYGATGRGLEKAGRSALEYLTAQDIAKGGPVETPSAPAVPSVPGLTEAEAGVPSLGTDLAAAGPAYGGTVVGTTPGGAIEFAPEGGGLIRTMDPTSGEVVFADPATVGRFAEQFREQRLASQQAQQRAITSPEGRAMTERMLGQATAPGSYAAESAAREARLAARPDFMEARPSAARQAGVMSMADARKLSGGDRDVAKRMIKLQEMGRDPLTGKLMDTPEEKAAELAGAKARTEYYNTLVGKAKKEDPDKLSLIEGYADRLGLTGEPRQTFIFGQLGGADIGDILGSGIPTPGGVLTTPRPTQEITAPEKQALEWAKENPNDPRTPSVLSKLGYTKNDVIDAWKAQGITL